jgi:hypothetical protein
MVALEQQQQWSYLQVLVQEQGLQQRRQQL